MLGGQGPAPAPGKRHLGERKLPATEAPEAPGGPGAGTAWEPPKIWPERAGNNVWAGRKLLEAPWRPWRPLEAPAPEASGGRVEAPGGSLEAPARVLTGS